MLSRLWPIALIFQFTKCFKRVVLWHFSRLVFTRFRLHSGRVWGWMSLYFLCFTASTAAESQPFTNLGFSNSFITIQSHIWARKAYWFQHQWHHSHMGSGLPQISPPVCEAWWWCIQYHYCSVTSFIHLMYLRLQVESRVWLLPTKIFRWFCCCWLYPPGLPTDHRWLCQMVCREPLATMKLFNERCSWPSQLIDVRTICC